MLLLCHVDNAKADSIGRARLDAGKRRNDLAHFREHGAQIAELFVKGCEIEFSVDEEQVRTFLDSLAELLALRFP